MTRHRQVLLAAAVVVLLAAPARAHHVADHLAGGGLVIGCLGDSNTQEWDPNNIHACGDTTQTTTWCTRLAAMVQPLGWTVQNHAVWGASVVSPNPGAPFATSTASQQWSAALAASPSPDVIVLAFGTNDLKRPANVIVSAYASLKQTIEATGRKVIIAVTPPQAANNVTLVNNAYFNSNYLIGILNAELRARFTGPDDLMDLSSGLIFGTSAGSVDYSDTLHMNNCGQQKRAVAAFEQLTHAHDQFAITVVDATTSTPISNLRLSTTNNIVYKTDAAGRIDLYEPGIMGTPLYLSFDACVDKPNHPPTKWCELTHTICTIDRDCTGGWDVPSTPLGDDACLRAVTLKPYEQGTVQIGLCPGGTAPACGSGSCQPTVVVGPNVANPLPLPSEYFKIRVVDAATGRGVPLIEVSSPSQTFVTDSAGNVAYWETSRMGTTVAFQVHGHGYANTNANLLAASGGTATIPVTRVNIAERLYRITGGGIYRDSVLLDESTPIAAPLLNRQVFGQDSALTAVYQNKIFWIWGDTSIPGGPIGTLRAPGAVSDLPGQGGLDPTVGVNLSYLSNGVGFVSDLCPVSGFPSPEPDPTAPTPCWLSTLSVVKDGSGTERMYARYFLVVPEIHGLAHYDDGLKRFVKDFEIPSTLPVQIQGHPEKVTHGSNDYLYYPTRTTVDVSFLDLRVLDNPVRVMATEAKLTDPSKWEAFTALRSTTTDDLVFRSDGTLNYDWKINTSPITDLTANTIYNGGPIPADQRLFGHTKDPESAAPLSWPSAQSTAWNAKRGRWVQPLSESFGTSFLGEVWYNEADTPMGPWVYARKIITHDNYTFYNPRLHPFFTQGGGRYVFFEDTYTTGYTNGAVPTPRYNYNQVMYRLDLDDPRLVLPVPVYDLAGAAQPGNFITKAGYRSSTSNEIATFMAPDRAGMTSTVPVWWNDAACKNRALVVGGTPLTTPIFWALPGNASSPPSTTTELYEFTKNTNGNKAYSIKTSLSGYTRTVNAIARVWTNPIRVRLPVTDYLASLVADAGSDKCATVSGGTASVNLSASASRNTNGTIASYQWTWTGGGSGSATGVTPTVVLPAGLYDIKLTITGSGGDTSTDNVVVRVSP